MKTFNRKVVERVVYKMLVENTGKALCDSGDAYGRHWQKNALKTLAHFRKEPAVSWDDEDYTISLFHYLTRGLDINPTCEVFNKKFVPTKDWESDFYGVSKAGAAWLADLGMKESRTFNSYNGESSLSQVIQGTWLISGKGCNIPDYLLLQIHQGCDVRGGYTDARLFYVPNYDEGALSEDVYGIVIKKNGAGGEGIRVDNTYNGISLTDEDGKSVEIGKDDVVKLELMER